MYTGNAYMLLFFIYGLAFFSMGISAFQKRTLKDSNFPLLSAIKQLGYFGITHGLVEWILMIIIWNEYPQYKLELLFILTLLNAISFTFLWMFGIKLLENGVIKNTYLKLLPLIVLGLWIIIFIYIYFINKSNYIHYIYIFIISSRYFMALPGCVTVCMGLYRNGKIIYKLKLKKISIKFNILALLFGLYGIFAGLIVRKHDFFPANILNVEMFRNVFGFPVEFARTIVALAITVLFINLIDIFMWEAEFRIEKLTKHKLICQERTNLGHELHDSVIQNLFAVGLMVENLIEDEDNKKSEELLNIKFILNEVINEIRGFISKSSIEEFNRNKFKSKLIELIDRLKIISKINIILNYKVPEITLGQLSSEKTVRNYVSKILKKINVTNRTEAALYFMRQKPLK